MTRELLLVDDDDSDAELFRLAAGETGLPFSIVTASSGEEALERALGGSPPPSVVVLDLKMPGISGLDTLARLREDPRTRGIYAVVLTSSDLPSDKAEALRLGCDQYLTKPASFGGYLELLERLKAGLPA